MCAFVYFIFKGEGIYLYEFTLVGRFPPRGARAFRRAQRMRVQLLRSTAERSGPTHRSGPAQQSSGPAQRSTAHRSGPTHRSAAVQHSAFATEQRARANKNALTVKSRRAFVRLA
jgi:hypothetical protein